MNIRDAVSLVIVCENEVFTIKRQNFLRSFPGYTAFPGGKIDQTDFEFNSKGKYGDIEAQHLGALVREGEEELGINFLTDLRVKSIDYMATALSPEFNPNRFNTFFYRIELCEKVKFTLDKGEFQEGMWLNPLEVINQWNLGLRLCVPPVRMIFEELAKNIDVKKVIFPKRYDLNFEVPHVEIISGLWQVMPLSDTVPPADRTNSFILGDDLVVMIDPSPKDKSELEKFLNTILQKKISKIFLTHHHGDHHRNLNLLLDKLKLPVVMSQDTYERISRLNGRDYFQGAQIEIAKHNDCLTLWKGKKVFCHHVPGHDEGHMALAPESLEWCIVGDLFQGIGTVVVGGEEGDMQKYFNTLQYIIDLQPGCVIPSHGIALGGVNIIEKTLAHRKLREEQILEMHQEGLSKQEMLERIYFDIPIKLHKYAMANINSHYVKLVKDGKIL